MPTEEQTIWEGAREELRRSLPAAAFQNWLEPLRAVGVEGTRFYVAGPTRVREWFERRYGAAVADALRNQAPQITDVVFAEPGWSAGSVGVERPSVPAALERGLDFDHFVIGAGNRFAHAAALAVAELPGEAYNPLFLYGEPGLGKTHLLISIANYLRRRHPGMSVVYTTAERFTSEFVSSVRGEGSAAQRFKTHYREVGALLIDDIQFLENKPRTEDEFFHTFNDLYAAGSQVVLSSDRPPEAMERLTERLRDRFAWGLTVKVESPDLNTRVTLLRRLAAERAIAAPDVDILRQIAIAAPVNLRKLEGALTRVVALASLLGQTPTRELVAEALGTREQLSSLSDPGSEPALEQIQHAVCDVLHVPLADMRSPRRAPAAVGARQLAMYVARNCTTLSLADIARGFDRDHSTVLHSIRTVEGRLEPGNDLHRRLERIHELLHVTAEPT